MIDWKRTADELPPAGLIVHTKIDNDDGCRNEQPLMFMANLWWFPDGSMYVYYCPTHWREMTPAERELMIAEQRVEELKRHNRRMQEIES